MISFTRIIFIINGKLKFISINVLKKQSVFFINFCQIRPISSSGSGVLDDLTLLSGFKFLQVEQNKSGLILWDRKSNSRFADLNFIYGMDYHVLDLDDVSKFYNMF